MLGSATSQRNNGNQQGGYSPTVYSRYSFSNPTSEIDKTALRVQYWKGLLKISILPKIEGTETQYDTGAAVSLHLSPAKAWMLKKEIENFEKGDLGYNNYGVNTPKGLITICDGTEFQPSIEPCPTLVIRRMENDQIVNTYAYQFKTKGFHFSIRNFNDSDMTFDQCSEDYKNLELEMFKIHLDEFIKAATMATAYSVMDASSYVDNSTYQSLNQIKGALGLEVRRRGGTGTSDFFSKPKSPQRTYTSMDDLENGDGINLE